MINKIIAGYVTPKGCASDTLFIKHSSFKPQIRFHVKYDIPSESVHEVEVLFLADKHQLIRYIFKELDILLGVGGVFKLEVTEALGHGNGIRSLSQIKHEFSISTHGRYRLKTESRSGTVSLIYEKVKSVLIPGDSIDCWSFGIITNGKNTEKVNVLISSIEALHIPEYEVIVCGQHDTADQSTKVFDIDVDDRDLRAPITRKKNKIAEKAKYENLVILHDRYIFPEDWFTKMSQYGNNFELLAIPNIGPKGGRVNDWPVFLGLPSQPRIVGSYLLPYSSYSYSLYMQGGLMIVKRSVFNDIKLDENLYWGELEDVAFSKIAYLKGYFLYIDKNNRILTSSGRISESRNLNKVLNLFRSQVTRLRRITYLIRNLFNHFINVQFKRK